MFMMPLVGGPHFLIGADFRIIRMDEDGKGQANGWDTEAWAMATQGGLTKTVMLHLAPNVFLTMPQGEGELHNPNLNRLADQLN